MTPVQVPELVETLAFVNITLAQMEIIFTIIIISIIANVDINVMIILNIAFLNMQLLSPIPLISFHS